MKILAIDIATSVAGCAIAEEDKLLAVSCLDVGKTHSERLLPMVQAMFQATAVSFADLAGYAVTIGPGSFTGLRIGLATVKAFYHAYPLPIVPICTLDALAYQGRGLADWICPVLDARKNEVYYALYDKTGTRVWEPGAMAPAMLAAELAKKTGKILFLGDGAEPYQAVFARQLGQQYCLMPPERRVFSADAAARLGLEQLLAGNTVTGETLHPFYLRKSEAECRLEAKRQAQ